MKQLLYLLITAAFVVSCGGSKQASKTSEKFRAQAPEAGPAPVISLKEPSTFTLENGLTVIVVENHKLPTVNMSLYFDYPSLLEGDKAGYTSFFGEIMRAGTSNLSKEELDEELDFYGIDLFTSSRSIGFDALTKQMPKALELTKDVLFNATFSNADVLDKLKKQYITDLQAGEKNPDAIMDRVGNALLYGKNHPLGEFATEESFSNIQLADLQTHYNTYWKPNIAYLTFVGDITTAEAKQIAEEHFAAWNRGDIPSFDYPSVKNVDRTEVNIIDLPSATQSNIYITNVEDLKKSNSDYFAAELGDHILGGSSFARLFLNLREDKGYTYGAYSSLRNDHVFQSRFNAYAKVRNEVTDSSLMAFFDELNQITTKPVSEQMLKTAISEQTGRFALRLERPSTIASYARTTLIEDLPSDFYSNYLKQLNAQSPQTVLKAMQNYVLPNQARIIIVGKASDIVDDVRALGYPVRFFDIWANELEDPTIQADVSNISTNDVFQKHIDAIGGYDNLIKVNDLTQTYESTIPGLPGNATATISSALPNLNKMVFEAEGVGEFLTTAFNGTVGYMNMMGQKTEFSGEELKQFLARRPFFDELNMSDYKAVVDNIVTVNGQKYLKLINTYSNDFVIEKLYNMETGLLFQEDMTVEQDGQKITSSTRYEDYREIEGIKYPHKVIISSMGQDIPLSLQSVKTNSGLTSRDFN